MFHSLAEIPMKIEKVLIDHGITVHKSERMKKYRRDRDDRYAEARVLST